MGEEYGEFVGVDNIHAAIIIEDSEANYTTEQPEYLAPAAEIAGEAETESTTTYYDNVPGSTYNSEGATALTMTISGIPADKAAKYLGKHYDPATGRVLDDGDPNPPECAVSFRFNRGKNGYRYYQYLKGTFSGGAEEASSKSKTVDIKTYQMKFTAVNTTHQWLVDEIMKSMKRIFGDTSDDNFNAAGFFDAVQTPETGVQPVALSLVSSIPDDNATDIAVDSNIVLTFNNKVSSQIITLFTDTFVPVSAVITKDTTGKILTIKPETDLSAATSHTLILANVTDIYGQKLENEVIAFTTA